MTSEKFLVINGGSSSLKFALYSMPEEKELINGYIEKIGAPDCFWTLKINGEKIKHEAPLKNHLEAVETMMKELIDNKIIESSDEIKGVGHRIAHGGEYYPASVLIDDEVIKHIEELTKLVPLHHPGQIAAIKAMEQELANVPQVAVFDTSFHQTIPKENYIYAVPYEWYEKYGVRRYGFHGSSHQYITQEMQKRLGKKDVNLEVKKYNFVDEYNSIDYLPTVKRNIEDIMDEIELYTDEYIISREGKALNDYFFKDEEFLEKFKRAIGGVSMHHNYIGGLAEHTLGVMYLTIMLCERYDCRNKEVAILAAKLHDIGKIYELYYDGPFKYTLRGEMEGHIVIGTEMLDKAFNDNPGFYSDDFIIRMKGCIFHISMLITATDLFGVSLVFERCFISDTALL